MQAGADSDRRLLAAGAFPAPVSGRIADGAHRLAVRVYFEDTDLSGVVYHANYLRFMERGRSDLLQVLGIDQRAAHEAGDGVYVVADLQIRYLRPARLNDDLLVETRCRALGAAQVSMGQRILRGAEVLIEAQVRAGFLTPEGRPRRQPADWMQKFRTMLPADS
ncbi:YbgC/FadM family acyl-CoA thioesterase [Sandaracinobacter sp. RS1-74]|uniref:YbgC/FadM family acyl-CoA thioesterase n=1 Tax=Sandaracinobacteroides sayramensis TaxID=2913411 RepID=UPI001EDA8BB8|nr:YbgC/FadM family acyl-CoA thioesterase [Sandaracinobacteroides sayramensis]MCG2839802.1 YbgC/FadM family acyl-CoA thioesterase [Sandaracinobacteroides sayramensis]